jgi:hypothetical protein
VRREKREEGRGRGVTENAYSERNTYYEGEYILRKRDIPLVSPNIDTLGRAVALHFGHFGIVDFFAFMVFYEFYYELVLFFFFFNYLFMGIGHN